MLPQVLLTERFDEGLMVLRHLLRWHMIDMTYSTLMETKIGSQRYDGKYLKHAPKFDDLDKAVRPDAADQPHPRTANPYAHRLKRRAVLCTQSQLPFRGRVCLCDAQEALWCKMLLPGSPSPDIERRKLLLLLYVLN